MYVCNKCVQMKQHVHGRNEFCTLGNLGPTFSQCTYPKVEYTTQLERKNIVAVYLLKTLPYTHILDTHLSII